MVILNLVTLTTKLNDHRGLGNGLSMLIDTDVRDDCQPKGVSRVKENFCDPSCPLSLPFPPLSSLPFLYFLSPYLSLLTLLDERKENGHPVCALARALGA